MGAQELDQLEAAHASIGGTGRGRRFATDQINHAYAVLVASQFQRFCRDLHSEGALFIASAITPSTLGPMVQVQLTANRQLDRGNPTPGNLGSDFGRFGIELWPALHALDRRNRNRQRDLELLTTWRNAIAHQDFSKVGATPLRLDVVRSWRAACDQLAGSIDRAVGDGVARVAGARPW